MIKPIETVYNGYKFRSRLEARWAVFFDVLGIKYQYELEGFDLGEFGWYLPDFYLPTLNIWIEIKPQLALDKLDKSGALQLLSPDSHVSVLFDCWYDACHVHFVIGERADGNGSFWGIHTSLNTALFLKCHKCGEILYHRLICSHGHIESVYPATDIMSAYFAARQARFEHGRNGH